MDLFRLSAEEILALSDIIALELAKGKSEREVALLRIGLNQISLTLGNLASIRKDFPPDKNCR